MSHYSHPGSRKICVLPFNYMTLPKYRAATFRRIGQQGSGTGNSFCLLRVQAGNKINLLAWHP